MNVALQERSHTMTRRTLTLLFALAFALCFFLTGCNKATQENYDKIEVGMTYQEVVDILGDPDKTQDVMGARNCVWGKEPNVITIKFIADKVVFHSAKELS